MSNETDPCQKQDCTEPGEWRWWNGKGTFGPYCNIHAREQLHDERSKPAYKDPITRREDVSGTYVIPAGIMPVDATFPTIRTKEAFDTYLETDGEKPRLCRTSWCNNLLEECELHD